MSKKEKKRRDEPDLPSVDFEIDPENIKTEYMRIPAHIATLNAVYAQAVGMSIRTKYKRDRVYAEINAEIIESSDKKPAEAQIKQMIIAHPMYEEAVMRYAAAEEAKAFAWGQCEAISAKKDMIVSLGAHVRQELGPAGALEKESDDDEDDDDRD